MTSPQPDLEALADRAVSGDRDAIEELVRALEGQIYAIGLRMLWHREDAEDATQEILVRVVTRLSQFDHRSRLRTWVHRIATNYLLDVKKSRVEREKLSFTAFSEDLLAGLSDKGPAETERSLLVEEVRIGCTLAMLQCLDRPHRLAYVLGEILEWPGSEAALALDLAPAAYRKRLQRARDAVESFTRAYCGLVSVDAPCRCNRRVPAALACGRIREQDPQFATSGASFQEARALVGRLQGLSGALAVQRAASPAAPLRDLSGRVLAALAPPPARRKTNQG